VQSWRTAEQVSRSGIGIGIGSGVGGAFVVVKCVEERPEYFIYIIPDFIRRFTVYGGKIQPRHVPVLSGSSATFPYVKLRLLSLQERRIFPPVFPTFFLLPVSDVLMF
jgi:hypothetical protein